MCKESKKPCLVIEEFDEEGLRYIKTFITLYNVETLNVAGNRESKFPGLQQKVRNFLIEALGETDEFAD
jgi:hypothetical protein